jgi:hypothetical protein
MSSNTIRSIKIDAKNKKVFITSACNNVIPKDYYNSHRSFFDKFFDKEGGIEEIQKRILFSFFSGSYQGLFTNYGKAMQTFKSESGCWQKCIDDPEFKIDFENKLLNHFKEYEAKRKCKKVFNVKVDQGWIAKLTASGAKINRNQDLAKKFNLAIAETVLKRFSNHGAEIIEI